MHMEDPTSIHGRCLVDASFYNILFALAEATMRGTGNPALFEGTIVSGLLVLALNYFKQDGNEHDQHAVVLMNNSCVVG